MPRAAPPPPTAGVVAAVHTCAEADVASALRSAVNALREQVGSKSLPAQLVAEVADWLATADLTQAPASRTLARLTRLWTGRVSSAVARPLLDVLVPRIYVAGEHVDGCLTVLAHIARVRATD